MLHEGSAAVSEGDPASADGNSTPAGAGTPAILKRVAAIAMPTLCLALSVAFLINVAALDWSAKGYPTAVAIALLVFSAGGLAAELVRFARRSVKAQATDDPQGQASPVGPARRSRGWPESRVAFQVAATAVLLVALAIAAPRAGMLNTFAVYLPLQMLVLGERSRLRLLVTDVCAISLFYLIFVQALNMNLPT